jgi:hypothetical protein
VREKIDSILLRTLETLCQRFESLTGLTNFWWKNQVDCCGVVLGSWIILRLIGSKTSLIVSVPTSLFIGFIAFLLLSLSLFGASKMQERDAINRLLKGYQNPEKIDPELIKMRMSTIELAAMIGMIVWLFQFDLLVPLFFGMMALRFYLRACDPLPPGGKKRKPTSLIWFFKKSPSHN